MSDNQSVDTHAEPTATTSSEGSIAKILTPVDVRHADEARKSIAIGCRLARCFGAQYSLITVAYPLGEGILDTADEREPEFAAFVADCSAAFGLDIEPIFAVFDAPAEKILNIAHQQGFDLIVMGTHDPKLTDYLLGSNASSIALHASCSVMVVR